MGLFKTRRSDYVNEPDLVGGRTIRTPVSLLEKFGPEVLGLGEIDQPSRGHDVICVMFDLAGFTTFCRQVDPHLAVPEFLHSYLEWLFEEIKRQSIREAVSEDVLHLYNRLPFFAKFMGDGVMFLWSTDGMAEEDVINVAVLADEICLAYGQGFYRSARRVMTDPPDDLRAGVARGRVFSVGNGSDFVGPCINIAARLQKLASTARCCISRRGMDVERHGSKRFRDLLVLKEVSIRGIGDHEVVYLRKMAFGDLPQDERHLFRDPGAA